MGICDTFFQSPIYLSIYPQYNFFFSLFFFFKKIQGPNRGIIVPRHSMIRPIRHLLVPQLTKRPKSHKPPLPIPFAPPLHFTLQDTFRRRAHKVNIPILHLFDLGPHGDGSLAAGTNNDAGPLDGFECGFGAGGFQCCHHHAEFGDGGIIQDCGGGGGVGGLVEGRVGVVDGLHFLGGDGRVAVGQHAD